jgi:tRNA threonylcarbamoyladenosine biosynthesis protein TsaE
MKVQSKSIILDSEQDSLIFARDMGQNLGVNDIITFSGDLGSGKTFICREIIKTLCGNDTQVTSPTFNLLQIYTTSKFTIYHFDLYRLKCLDEIYELGIEDALLGNVCLIEWPEIIETILPKPRTRIVLEILENTKRLCQLDYQA